MYQSNISGTLSNKFEIGKKLWFTNEPNTNDPDFTLSKDINGLNVKNIQYEPIMGSYISNKIYIEQNFLVGDLDKIIRAQDFWFYSRLQNDISNLYFTITSTDFYGNVLDTKQNLNFSSYTNMVDWINQNITAPYCLQYSQHRFNHLIPSRHYGVNYLYSVLKGRKNYLKPLSNITDTPNTLQKIFVQGFLDYYFNVTGSSYLNTCFFFGRNIYSLYKLLHLNQIIDLQFKQHTIDGKTAINNTNGTLFVESSHIAYHLDGQIYYAGLKTSTWYHRRNQINKPNYSAIAVYVLANGSNLQEKSFYIKPLGVDQIYMNYFNEDYILQSVEKYNGCSKEKIIEANPIRQDKAGDRQHYRIYDLISKSSRIKKSLYSAKADMPQWNFRLLHRQTGKTSGIGDSSLIYNTLGQFNPGSFYIK